MFTEATRSTEAMSREPRTDLQKERQASRARDPEQTRSGAVYTPAADIFETDNSITVLADLPGVQAGDLTIDLRENVLTLTGRIAAPESRQESDVLREYPSGSYFRQFTLSERIDQAKIDAQLSNGVLRLELPKVERAKPRQIVVKVTS